MTEEERKTMIRIATEVDGLNLRVRGLEEKSPGVPTVGDNFEDPMRSFLRTPPGMRITSTIEHTDRAKRFKMDVQFEGAHLWQQRDRMMKCEVFLQELEDLFREYSVIKLTGTYVGNSQSIQA